MYQRLNKIRKNEGEGYDSAGSAQGSTIYGVDKRIPPANSDGFNLWNDEIWPVLSSSVNSESIGRRQRQLTESGGGSR